MKFLNLFLLGLLIVFPFGQLVRIPISIPLVNLYFQDVIIALLVFSWLIWHFQKKRNFVLPPLARPIFGFVIIAFVSWLINVYQHSFKETVIAFLYLWRWVGYAGVYLVVYEATWLHHSLSRWLIGAGLASAIVGLLQYTFLPDTRFLYYSGWDEHYYRVIGSFLDPGFAGMVYVLTLILIIERFWNKKSILCLPVRQAGPLFSILYLALSLTYSRASYLAYLVGMGVIAWLKRSLTLFILAFLLLVVMIPLLPRPGGEGIKLERTSTIQARFDNYKNTLRIAVDHPILGVGFNFYRYAQRDYDFLGEDWRFSHAGAGADSSLLFVLVTTGFIGLAFYLWLLWEMVKISPAVILALVAHSFFNNSLFYPWIMLWVWFLLGIRGSNQE